MKTMKNSQHNNKIRIKIKSWLDNEMRWLELNDFTFANLLRFFYTIYFLYTFVLNYLSNYINKKQGFMTGVLIVYLNLSIISLFIK